MSDQQELKDMPKKDLTKKFGAELGGALLKLINAWEKLQDFKQKVTDAKDELMPIMLKQKEFEIKVDGKVIRYKEGEDHINVSRQPNKE